MAHNAPPSNSSAETYAQNTKPENYAVDNLPQAVRQWCRRSESNALMKRLMKQLWANKMIAITAIMTLTLVPILLLLWWFMSTL